MINLFFEKETTAYFSDKKLKALVEHKPCFSSDGTNKKGISI